MKEPAFLTGLRARFTPKQSPKKLKKPKVRVSSAQVRSASRDHAHELSILWWRWRHHFLEAKRIELQGNQDE